MIISFYLIFNVFMMILLNLFEEFYQNPLNPIQFFKKYLNKFKIAWSYFYTLEKEKNFIGIENLTEFLLLLGSPLGLF